MLADDDRLETPVRVLACLFCRIELQASAFAGPFARRLAEDCVLRPFLLFGEYFRAVFSRLHVGLPIVPAKLGRSRKLAEAALRLTFREKDCTFPVHRGIVMPLFVHRMKSAVNMFLHLFETGNDDATVVARVSARVVVGLIRRCHDIWIVCELFGEVALLRTGLRRGARGSCSSGASVWNRAANGICSWGWRSALWRRAWRRCVRGRNRRWIWRRFATAVVGRYQKCGVEVNAVSFFCTSHLTQLVNARGACFLQHP